MDNFPELGLFRDIAFLFHLMTQPSSDALPEVKRWKPVDVALSWKVKKIQVRRLFSKSLVSTPIIMGSKEKETDHNRLFSPACWCFSAESPQALLTQKI